MSLRIVLICALFLMMLSIANAESVSIPLKTIKKPSSDLISAQGEVLDSNRAAILASQGVDLSALNPQESKLWQNRVFPAEEANQNFPTARVKFKSHEAELPFTYMARVQSLEGDAGFYRMTLSRYTHTALMRAALLRKLGYFVPSPKYYRQLTVVFDSEDQKKEFLKTSQEAMVSDFESRGWVLRDNKQDHSVTFVDVVLETPDVQFFDTYWGYAPNPNDPNQLPTVQRFSKYRAYRALILPYALVDVPESVNRYSAKFASVLSGHVVIQHPSAESFAAVTYEDARWLARRMSQLNIKDWDEIVEAGAFPEEISELVRAKLLYRVNNCFEFFAVSNRNISPLPTLAINSRSGLIQDGKVTKEMVPGYPQRFAHGDRESPFKDGDFSRYLDVRGKTVALSTAIDEINKKLQVLSIQDAITGRKQEIQNRIAEHIRNHPKEALYQKVEAWGAPLVGFNLSSTRHVTTGTYYGSSAAIQLVDNLSVGASLGYFVTWDGIAKASPVVGANVMAMRDYTHVRPLLSIAEGTNVSWKNIVLPRFMGNLSKVLNDQVIQKTQDGVKINESTVDAFLKEMREGEVFTVTDSVALASYLQANSSFDVLMGLSPLNFINSVSIGGDSARVTLRQTSFMRTREGVQIFVRTQNSRSFGLSLDAQYFVKLLSIRASTTATDLHTDAFVIDYNTELGGLVDSNADQDFVKKYRDTQDKLRPVLRGLFDKNDTEMLYSKFRYQKFDINHKLNTKEFKTKVLWSRMNNYSEEHTLQIQYPENPDHPELNPADEKVTLYSFKRGELKGRDLLGLTIDFISALFDKFGGSTKPNLEGDSDPNPANMPFGNAYWRTVNSETDLTDNGTPYPNVSTIQHVWGGWKLKRNDFFQLIDQIQDQFKNTPLASYRLIEKEAFQNVRSVDFYRITANLSILPGGLDKIQDLVLQPSAAGKAVERAGFIGRFWQRLSEKLGHKARAEEKEMFQNILKILGNGDYELGRAAFYQQCTDELARTSGDAGNAFPSGAWVNGNYYECMMPWMQKLIDLSGSYPSGKKDQARWMAEVLFVLDQQIPLPQLLRLVGDENFVFVVRINGFRTGDEDGDLEYFSNSLGDPKQNIEYANGLVNMFANKTRISPIELDRTQGGFR